MSFDSSSDPDRRPHINGHSSAKVSSTLLGNVDVRVETYLGETSMTVAELNALKSGGVVKLDAALNELVELRVNGVTIAHGELVAVGDKFGVRITSVAS
jgi:flagellar motor switch protein FliN